VGGELDLRPGGPPDGLKTAYQLAARKQKGRANFVINEEDRRRAVYGFVSRRKLDPVLSLFDFPNPNSTSEQRNATNVPPQRLYFMNNEWVIAQAKAMTARLKGTDAERIDQAYRLLFQRPPSADEKKLALEFLHDAADNDKGWAEYAQVLMTSNEFQFVD
jgi:hypothetical protein